MFYAHAQRLPNVNVYSGIDMALWDLAGKILNKPVHKLLGGPFRTEIDTLFAFAAAQRHPGGGASGLPEQG